MEQATSRASCLRHKLLFELVWGPSTQLGEDVVCCWCIENLLGSQSLTEGGLSSEWPPGLSSECSLSPMKSNSNRVRSSLEGGLSPAKSITGGVWIFVLFTKRFNKGPNWP